MILAPMSLPKALLSEYSLYELENWFFFLQFICQLYSLLQAAGIEFVFHMIFDTMFVNLLKEGIDW